MKTLLEKIAVMQAFADGKEIQRERNGSNAGFISDDRPQWDWYTYDYRVKPREPKVIYVNEYDSHEHIGHPSKELAVNRVGPFVVRKAVKYQEVIEDEQG